MSAGVLQLAAAALCGLGLYLALRLGRERLNSRARAAVESLLGRMEGLEQAGCFEQAERALDEAGLLLDRHFSRSSKHRVKPLKRMAGYYERREEPAKAVALLEPAAAILKGKLGLGAEGQIAAFELGLLKWKNGEEEPALRMMERSLSRLSRGRSPRARRSLGRLLNEMALVYREQGRRERAEQTLARAVKLVEKRRGDRAELAVYYANQASLKEEAGDLAAGLELLKKALARVLESKESEETARMIERLQAIASELPWPEQEEFFRERVRELSASGADQELRQLLSAALADCLTEAGKAEESLDLIKRETAGQDLVPGLGRALLMRSFARWLTVAGAGGEAVHPLRDALRILEHKLGGQDEAVITTGIELAELLDDEGRLEEAAVVLQGLLDSLEQSKLRPHPDLPLIYLRLLELLIELEDYQQAEEQAERATATLARLVDPSPELRTKLLLYRAKALIHLDQAPAAAPLLEQCIELSRQNKDPAAAAAAWFYLSSSRQAEGDLDQALLCAQTASQTYAQAGIAEPDLRAAVFARLSAIHAARGEREKSTALAGQAMDLWVEEQKPDSETASDQEFTLDDFFRPEQ